MAAVAVPVTIARPAADRSMHDAFYTAANDSVAERFLDRQIELSRR